MPNARVTLKAMEKWMNEESKSISDTWNLTTPSDLYDKEILMYTIMQKGGVLEPTNYDPDEFYSDCAFWWVKWKRTFDKWVEALSIEYNPLENYDRMEDWTDEGTDNGSHTIARTTTEVTDDDSSTTQTNNTRQVWSETGSADKTGTESTSEDKSHTLDATNTEQVAAFNNENWENSKKVTTDEEGTEDNTITTTYNLSDDTTHTSTTTNDGTVNISGADDKTVTTTESITDTNDGTKDSTHTGRMHGNIGVTTSQQMLTAELDLQYWNLYNHMADLFIREMTTRVY